MIPLDTMCERQVFQIKSKLIRNIRSYFEMKFLNAFNADL